MLMELTMSKSVICMFKREEQGGTITGENNPKDLAAVYQSEYSFSLPERENTGNCTPKTK